MPPNDTKQRNCSANQKSSCVDDDDDEGEQEYDLSSSSIKVCGREPIHQIMTGTTIDAFIPQYLRHLVHPHKGDYCYTTCFQPSLVGQLMMEGFLPIACEDTICLPKLHEYRCLIYPLSNLHVSKSTRKKSKHFKLTLNQSFDWVVRECRRQHGDGCWLYPNLVEAFHSLHQNPYMAKDSSSSSCTKNGVKERIIPVRVQSIEVWNDTTGELAAGELGYTVGAIYTSLTGFTIQDSAGSVQLAALGRLLQQSGFAVWDLGMVMDYKASLGSQDVPRPTFLQLLHEHRTVDTALSFVSPAIREQNCRALIDR